MATMAAMAVPAESKKKPLLAGENPPTTNHIKELNKLK
jgi:hypothetical protein